MTVEIGQPYGEVPPKRSFDNVPVAVDWHDYLVNLWAPGRYFSGDAVIRLPRAISTGKQYRAVSDGVSGASMPRFPKNDDDEVTDGSVVWRAEPVSIESQRTTIAAQQWSADSGVSLGTEATSDLIYQVLVDGGEDGGGDGVLEDGTAAYRITHQITLANGEEKEGVVLLPVRDS